MAKYRLLSAHYLDGDVWLPGDKEMMDRGDNAGTLVGDGTPYPVKWPTLEMEPLDDEARVMIEREKKRLEINEASMNPIEDMEMDAYEQNYVPGINKRRRAPLPTGTPIGHDKPAEID